jgi:hypothetical protein
LGTTKGLPLSLTLSLLTLSLLSLPAQTPRGESITDYTDWKSFDGITLPVAFTNTTGGQQTGSGKVTTMEINPPSTRRSSRNRRRSRVPLTTHAAKGRREAALLCQRNRSVAPTARRLGRQRLTGV